MRKLYVQYGYSFCMDLCVISLDLAVSLNKQQDMCNMVAQFVTATLPRIPQGNNISAYSQLRNNNMNIDVTKADATILKSSLDLVTNVTKKIPNFIQWDGIGNIIQLSIYTLQVNGNSLSH